MPVQLNITTKHLRDGGAVAEIVNETGNGIRLTFAPGVHEHVTITMIDACTGATRVWEDRLSLRIVSEVMSDELRGLETPPETVVRLVHPAIKETRD